MADGKSSYLTFIAVVPRCRTSPSLRIWATVGLAKTSPNLLVRERDNRSPTPGAAGAEKTGFAARSEIIVAAKSAAVRLINPDANSRFRAANSPESIAKADIVFVVGQ